MAQRTAGKVKWFNYKEGYGFIVPDSAGRDIFVHKNQVEKSGLEIEDLKEGTAVTFEVNEFRGKNQAEHIELAA